MANNKHCPKCGKLKSVSEFNKDSRSGDGLRSFCRECQRLDGAKYREENREKKRASDRAYMLKNRKAIDERSKRWRQNKANRQAMLAQRAVGIAVRSGKMIPENCTVCGSSEYIHAHHHDYSKPLDVIWLCAKCHRLHHSGHTLLQGIFNK